MIGSANEQHAIKIAKRVKAFYNGYRGLSPMIDQHVHKLSYRWPPGATLSSFASSDGDPNDDGVGRFDNWVGGFEDWVDRFEITKPSRRSLHFTAPTGAR